MLIPLPPTGLSFRIGIPEQSDAKVLISAVIAGLYVLVVLVYTFTDVPANEKVLLATSGLLVSLLVGGATAELVKSRVVDNSHTQHTQQRRRGPRNQPPPPPAGEPAYNDHWGPPGRYPYDYPPRRRERRGRPRDGHERRPSDHRRGDRDPDTEREEERMSERDHRGGGGRPEPPTDPDPDESRTDQRDRQNQRESGERNDSRSGQQSEDRGDSYNDGDGK